MSDTFSADCRYCGEADDCIPDENGKMKCSLCAEAAEWFDKQKGLEGLNPLLRESMIGLLSLYKEA